MRFIFDRKQQTDLVQKFSRLSNLLPILYYCLYFYVYILQQSVRFISLRYVLADLSAIPEMPKQSLTV
jgi:hypothetical protein